MLINEQQEQVENLVIGLEISDHPIEQVFTSAKDFENPTKEVLRLYLECYSTYSVNTLYDIRHYLDILLSIRDKVSEDLENLGFDFDLNNLYEGLKYFLMFLSELLDRFQLYSEYDEENDGYTYKELSEKDIEYLVDICFSRIKIEKAQRTLTRELDSTIAELRTHILNEDSDIDMQQVIDSLNALFTACGLRETSDNEDVIINTIPYFDVPYISDTNYFSIVVGNHSQTIFINKKLEIIFNIIKFLWNREEFWTRVNTLKPSPELLKQLERDKKIYGAKGAYLRFLRGFIEGQSLVIKGLHNKQVVEGLFEVKTLLEDKENITLENADNLLDKISTTLHTENISGFELLLLPSIEISIELYKKWKRGINISGELEEIYNNANQELFKKSTKSQSILDKIRDREAGLPDEVHGLMVRSSAVNSEDSKKTSGAGVYESKGNIHSLEEFIKAVGEIFESVDSEKALVHRNEYEIIEEYMGLVIMPFMQTSNKYMGYANTSRAGKPNLMDVKDMNGKQATLNKDLLLVDFETEIHFGSYISQLYNIDTWSSDIGFQLSDTGMAKVLPIMFCMEKYFNHPMQFEFISESGRGSGDIYVVQMRPLNLTEIDSEIPEFPNEEYIYEGKAIIPGDIIVDTSDILIKTSSWEASLATSMSGSSLVDYVSRGHYDAVVITDGFSVNSGHIETMCSEKGIICICDDPLNENDVELRLEDYKKVRIISDGEIARIYPVDVDITSE